MDHLYELKMVVNPFWKKGARAGGMYILSTWQDSNGDLCVSHIRRHKIKGLYSK